MSGPCTDCGGPDYQTLEADLAEANATIDGMDSWAGMMEQARKHYPQDVAYFAQSNDPGCRIVRGLHAIDAERQRADRAEAERDALREWRAGWDGVCRRCPRSEAKAELTERDRMLDEAWRWAWGYTMTKDDWLADLRARAEEGNDDE